MSESLHSHLDFTNMPRVQRQAELNAMQKKRVRKLVAELRYGNYAQAKGALETVSNGKLDEVTGRCCLGVACHVAKTEHVDLLRSLADSNEFVYYDSSSSVLPTNVMRWYGFTDPNPMLHAIVRGEDAYMSAAELNDGGMPFSEIADAFERTYLPEDRT